MKDSTKWLAYNELAWTEPIIAPPEEYAEETELLVNAIEEHSRTEVKTLLNLGCGAGGNDYTFKKHYKVTGVDISEGMLEIARHLNRWRLFTKNELRRLKEEANKSNTTFSHEYRSIGHGNHTQMVT